MNLNEQKITQLTHVRRCRCGDRGPLSNWTGIAGRCLSGVFETGIQPQTDPVPIKDFGSGRIQGSSNLDRALVRLLCRVVPHCFGPLDGGARSDPLGANAGIYETPRRPRGSSSTLTARTYTAKVKRRLLTNRSDLFPMSD